MSGESRPALDTVLLLALPASGKSEVRTYLDHVSDDVRRRDFRMNPSVQLDDFPYVHFMRRVDDELVRLGKPRVYFRSSDAPFIDPRGWGMLIECLNEDVDDLRARRVAAPPAPGAHLLHRLEEAAAKVGAGAIFGGLDARTRGAVASALDAEAAKHLTDKHANYPATLEGKTLVIEFARGGPDNAKMPLPDPIGYRYSIGRLSDSILERASVLYIWVEPEEAKRKNRARSNPDDPGSILHHGVPEEVMRVDYGCDDIAHLVATSEKKGAITIATRGRKFHLPVGRVDNRVDKTSFLRDDPKTWRRECVDAVHAAIRDAVAGMAS